jgi:hypothetical protein
MFFLTMTADCRALAGKVAGLERALSSPHFAA